MLNLQSSPFFHLMCCFFDLSVTRVHAFVSMCIWLLKSCPLVCVSVPSTACHFCCHYHIHLLRRYHLLPRLSIPWPLGLALSHAGHVCLYLFYERGVCFGCNVHCRGKNRTHLQLLQKLEIRFDPSDDAWFLCFHMSFIHGCNQLSSEVGSSPRKRMENDSCSSC